MSTTRTRVEVTRERIEAFMPVMSKGQLDEARGWIADCGDLNAQDRTDRNALAVIEAYYEGGITAFHADTQGL